MKIVTFYRQDAKFKKIQIKGKIPKIRPNHIEINL